MSYWESGKRRARPEDVARYLQCIGVTGNEFERVVGLAHDAHADNWLDVTEEKEDKLSGLIACERDAAEIDEWCPLTIPGLLQTVDTARAIIESGREPSDETEHRIVLRAGRAHILRSEKPTPYQALIGEAALHAPIGGQSVHARQMQHLTSVIDELPSLTVQVVPLATPFHPGMMGPFSLFRFAKGEASVLHLEHHRASAFITDEALCNEYLGVIRHMIKDVALSPRDSRSLVADFAARLA